MYSMNNNYVCAYVVQYYVQVCNIVYVIYVSAGFSKYIRSKSTIDLPSEQFSPISLTISKPIEETVFWGHNQKLFDWSSILCSNNHPDLAIFGDVQTPRLRLESDCFLWGHLAVHFHPHFRISVTCHSFDNHLDLKTWNCLKASKQASKVF